MFSKVVLEKKRDFNKVMMVIIIITLSLLLLLRLILKLHITNIHPL